MITRRHVVLSLGAGALVMPLAASSQQKVWRIGVLNATNASAFARGNETLTRSLSDLGYVEGRNVVIERRFGEGDRERLLALARELVESKVDVMLAMSSFATGAALQATKSIPIVMTGAGDPVKSGFVVSLAHPGGNVTGLTNVSINISSKYLELLHEMVPKIKSVAVLINPAHPNHPAVLRQIQATASSSKITIVPVEVPSIEYMESALRRVAAANVHGLIIPADPTFPVKQQVITEFALNNRLPTMFGGANVAEAGGLLGYTPDGAEIYQRAAALIDKILRGAKPADIPVEFSTRFELSVNLKTAKALGLKIPQSILVRATKVIE